MTKVENRKRRILVVETESELLSMLCDFLASQRFEVETAQTGDQGVETALEFDPDIILLSRELPLADGAVGPDGLRALKLIRQDRKLSRTPVILTSAEATEKDFDRYRKLKFSADDYVKKPFEDTEILRRIENLVGFDLSEDMDRIKESIHDVIDDEPIISIFDADPEELGISSAATRQEVARLLEQVGLELDRPDEAMDQEEKELETLLQGRPTSPEAVEVEDEEVRRLRQEVQVLNRTLDLVQKQLVGERKRSRELKREWKKRLQDIAGRLKKSEEREARMRDEFSNMREQVADLELDHTMEMERVQTEKRRLEEELLNLRELEGPGSAGLKYPPKKMAEDLKTVAQALQAILSRMEGEGSEEE